MSEITRMVLPGTAAESSHDGRTRTHYTETDHDTSSTTKTVDGHHVSFETDTESSSSTTGEFDDRVKGLIETAEHERQAIEDLRAIRRNRNRLMTMLAAIVIGLAIVWTLPRMGSVGKAMEPYSFIATVALDTLLTLYAYIKRY